MKIFRTTQIREIDAFTIDHEPISSVDLMERAATRAFEWIFLHTSAKKMVRIFAGPGNNGGDALVIARLLLQKKCNVEVYSIGKVSALSRDAGINYGRLKKIKGAVIKNIGDKDPLPAINSGDIVIDGLFGSGLSRPLEGLAARVVRHINASGAEIIAIDIPSGLFGEDNSTNTPKNIIQADHTLTFQFPKLSFLFPENQKYTGEWHILPIGLHEKIIEKMKTNYFFVMPDEVNHKIRPRKKFAHKGHFGHALLVSGSYGKMGAAVLASGACLRTGAGLLTVHIPEKGYHVIQTAVPEAMVSIDRSPDIFSCLPDLKIYNAIAVGPGIGTHPKTQKSIKDLLEKSPVPLVLDADAINILGENKKWIGKIPANSILTPHPKEFERLAGKYRDDYSRNMAQLELANQYNIYIVLKGAHTSIACPDGKCYFNSSGNPGMATAGSGDVLTGMILSLMAQGYPSEDAAVLGVYLHGLSGDIAAEKQGQEAMIAGDIIHSIGIAYNHLKKA